MQGNNSHYFNKASELYQREEKKFVPFDSRRPLEALFLRAIKHDTSKVLVGKIDTGVDVHSGILDTEFKVAQLSVEFQSIFCAVQCYSQCLHGEFELCNIDGKSKSKCFQNYY